MDFFSLGLSIASLCALLGAARRVRGWRRWRLSSGRPAVAFSLQGLAAGLADVLLLRRTFRTSRLRWAGHMLVVLGFVPLLVLHAMDGVVTASLFSGYEPTLDPWQMGRNVCGLICLTGLFVLAGHRWRTLSAASGLEDWALLGGIFVIISSGFVLEAAKIAAPGDFERMAEEYLFAPEPEEYDALRAYWAYEHGVRFEDPLPTSAEVLAQGRTVHEDSCAACHAPTATAFVSRALVRVLPRAVVPARSTPRMLWLVHVGSAFLALALLAWGKWMHPLATTANLVFRRGRTHSDGTAPQGLALDACTRCGQCSLHCSVAPSFRVLGNRDILPMEKLADLRAWLAQTDRTTPPALLVEGSHICTECLRCTEICPAGIDLQDLWMRSKGALADAGRAGVDGEIRKRSAAQWAQELAKRHVDALGPSGSGLADRAESFWGCVQCTTCTSVCPVVAVSPDPARDLDLTPQQIMNYLRMGLKAQTLGARMVWSCTTCYKCQEYCPQGVPVADILYELRNLGAEILRRKEGGA
jgi:heterodisulfide reductase subunit C/nitrate reductase gamma subunit